MVEYRIVPDGPTGYGVELTSPNRFLSVRGFATERDALAWIQRSRRHRNSLAVRLSQTLLSLSHALGERPVLSRDQQQGRSCGGCCHLLRHACGARGLSIPVLRAMERHWRRLSRRPDLGNTRERDAVQLRAQRRPHPRPTAQAGTAARRGDGAEDARGDGRGPSRPADVQADEEQIAKRVI